MAHIDSGILGAGTFLVVSFGIGSYKTGWMRSDVVGKFQNRLTDTEFKLGDLAADGLQRLAFRVSTALGGLDKDARPSDVLADPVAFLPDVLLVAKTLQQKRQVRVYYKWLLRMGPILSILLGIASASTILVTFYFCGWGSHYRSWAIVATYLGSIAIVSTVVTSFAHQRLLNLFSNAELLAAGEANS